MVISQKESNTFWQLKAFAIFTVFFAHMPILAEDNATMAYVFDTIGMVGVPLFILISGYFSVNSKSSIGDSFRKLFIPLFIWATVCFILHIIKSPTETIFVDWLKFVMGSKSIFYFVPMLFCCMILRKVINDYFLLFMGICSQILTTYTNIIPYSDVWTSNLNPLNFIVYFEIGRIIQKLHITEEIDLKKAVGAFFIIIAFLTIGKPQYYGPLTFIFTINSFLLFYYCLSQFSNTLFIKIGKISFVIYLCHIQIAGFIQAIYKPLWGTWLEPTKVLIAFVIVCIFCFTIQYILYRFHLNREEKWLGYR